MTPLFLLYLNCTLRHGRIQGAGGIGRVKVVFRLDKESNRFGKVTICAEIFAFCYKNFL